MATNTKKATPAADVLVSEIMPSAEDKTARVQVFLPKQEESGNAKIDQTETVTINGVSTRIPRGEYVSVPVPVYIQLRNRYPNI